MAPKYQRWKGIMKAYPYEEKRLSKYSIPYICQPKYNGFRCRAIRVEGTHDWFLLSSEENVFFSVPHINDQLTRESKRGILDGIDELDGELYRHGLPLEEISSIVTKENELHERSEDIQYYIFDIPNDKMQLDRILTLSQLGRSFVTKDLVVSKYFVANSAEEVTASFNELIDLNYEGIIVRNCVAPYERKRSTNIMKFKPKKHDCYKIVGYTEEMTVDGIPKGTLGALVLDSGDDSSNVFSCGTGFTQAERKSMWENRKDLKSKYAYIGYQHTSRKGVPLSSVFCKLTDGYIGD